MRELKIAVADSRQAVTWENKLTTWPDVVKRLRQVTVRDITAAAYTALGKQAQGEQKDVGGFVGGHLKDGKRRRGFVLSRSLLTLDIDTPGADFETLVSEKFAGLAAVIYSTFSHRPDNPRYRVVLPLARDVSADEYEAVGRRLAEDVGMDSFDRTTFEPHRLMYWPGRPSDVEPVCIELEGEPLNPDTYLGRFDNWRDTTTWPRAAGESADQRKPMRKMENPTTKNGVVGWFCRVFDVHRAIAELLPDVFAPGSGGDRYTYSRGESSNGMVVYDGGLRCFSNHGTDPAGGRMLNAFDLVRLHKFGHLDDADDVKPGTPVNRLPSYLAMEDWASELPEVDQLGRMERLAGAQLDFAGTSRAVATPGEGGAVQNAAPHGVTKSGREIEPWESTELEVNKKTKKPLVSVENFRTIIERCPQLQGIAYDSFADQVTVKQGAKLPWNREGVQWTDQDTMELRCFISREFGIYHVGLTHDALGSLANLRRYHPVRDYLAGLPEWDGVPRVDTLLVDYLGAADNAYTRAVTRKTMVAAVTRVHRPGTKFDNLLTLVGPQGAGKSTLFDRLAGPWYSDSLTLSDMKNKDAAEKMQGTWIMEIPELAGMQKTEMETVKAFLSRRDDKYRRAYGRVVESHPRQAIMVATTNAEEGFLRDMTGNRRFWPVAVSGKNQAAALVALGDNQAGAGVNQARAWDLQVDTINQIWAEAMALFRGGETLNLPPDIEALATEEQAEATEVDSRVGIVEEYLNTKLPEDWEDKDTFARRAWLGAAEEFGGTPKGTVIRTSVTVPEVWAECLGRDLADLDRRQSNAVMALLKQVPGWVYERKQTRVKPYGKQRYFSREEPDF